MTGADDDGSPSDAPHSRPHSDDRWAPQDRFGERTLPGWLREESTRRIARALALGVALGSFMVRAARR